MMRCATAAEVVLMLDWAEEEGWNPGIDDAAAFHAADPEGFFVAEAEGAPVAAISVVNHGAENAFLGLYLCRPAWRGRGIGLALWTRALAHAGGRSVGLDGVAAQQANYETSGFVRAGATSRLQGMLTPETAPGLRAAAAGDLPALIARDAAATGFAREAFLAAWLAPAPSRVGVTDEGRETLAVARACRDGSVKIGPVIADGAAQALALARAALAALGASGPTPVALDLPDTSRALAETLAARGFAVGFETARMHRGPAPQGDGRGLVIATMELG